MEYVASSRRVNTLSKTRSCWLETQGPKVADVRGDNMAACSMCTSWKTVFAYDRSISWPLACPLSSQTFFFFLSFLSFFFFPKLRACERFSIVIVRVAHAVFIRFNDVAELFKASSTN